jgi:hypothetical protein
MPALAGNALLAKFRETSSDKCRYVAKNGSDVFKAKIVELFDGKRKGKDGTNGALISPLEGPSEGKKLFISVDRLKGMQGRQPGFSPKQKDSPAEDEEEVSPVKSAKNKAAPKKAETKVEKKAQKPAKNDEEFDIESAREEMKDIAEALQDLMERATSLASFMENLEAAEEGDESPEEDEEEEKPAKAKASGKGKTRSAKPRHEDEDED